MLASPLGGTMTGDVVFDGVSKRYGDVWALKPLFLRVPAGKILSVLGPSGSGKSTLLNLCAGVISPTSGRVLIGGEDVTDTPIERRNIGVVFQSYALFPHLSVLENVAFPLRTKQHRAAHAVARQRAQEMLHLVGLHECEHRKPQELSGGQQQRVALARALVYRPRLLLLDEPLGALDPGLKQQLQDDILRLRDELGITIVYVTHDQHEAMSIADQVAVLRQGRLEQLGSPRAVYDQPLNEFVASFIGEANLVRGNVCHVGMGMMAIDVPAGRIEVSASSGSCVGQEVLLLVRPEAIQVDNTQSAVMHGSNRLSGRVRRVTFLGSFTQVIVEVAPGIEMRINCRGFVDRQMTLGTLVDLCWAASDTHVVGAVAAQPLMAAGSDEIGYQSLALTSREACEEAR